MRILLFILCAFAMLFGMAILGAAKSAIHEIEAFILFLIAAVLLIGAAIVDAIISAQTKIEAASRPAQGTTTQNRPPPLPASVGHTGLSESIANLPDESPLSEIDQSDDDEELANELFNDAKEYVSDGRKDKAISTLKELVRLYPETQAAEKARRNLQKSATSP